MKKFFKLQSAVSVMTVFLSTSIASPVEGQQEQQDDAETLRRQIEQMQADSREQEAAHRRRLEELQSQLDRIEEEQERLARNAGSNGGAPDPGTSLRPRAARGQSFIDISAIGTFAVGASTEEHLDELQAGGHDPQQRGFNVQSLELVFSGIVDPYFRAQANVVFAEGGHGHGGEGGSSVELEEAFLETLALPGNLEVRAGQFLTEFGRQNTRHLHTWDFVDMPLISARMFGPEGLRNPGARVSWLAPTPFYSELFFTVQNSTGETAYSFRNPEGFGEHVFFRGVHVDEEGAEEIHSAGDLLYSTRYAASFDLTERQTILGGVSAAFGPNSPTEDSGAGRTDIYGADLYWHWTPSRQVAGFPFVSWQTEAMLRRFEMRSPSETFEDYGFYSQVNYGFARGWVAGLRYDWVRGDLNDAVDDAGEELPFPDRWRISPNLTFYPSEFSKIRVQYNYDERDGGMTDHTVWLQCEFSIGPHGAHTF